TVSAVSVRKVSLNRWPAENPANNSSGSSAVSVMASLRDNGRADGDRLVLLVGTGDPVGLFPRRQPLGRGIHLMRAGQAVAGARRSGKLHGQPFRPGGGAELFDHMAGDDRPGDATMGDRRAEGRGAGKFRIDMNRIEISGHLGIGVDVLL